MRFWLALGILALLQPTSVLAQKAKSAPPAEEKAEREKAPAEDEDEAKAAQDQAKPTETETEPTEPAAPVVPPPPASAPPPAEKTPDVELSLRGYVQAGLGFRYRADALPRDEWELAFTGQSGLIVEATVLKDFRALVHAILSSRTLEALTGVEGVDFEGNGSLDAIVARSKRFPAALLEEASMGYLPVPEFGLKAGVMLIPFTTQLQSPSFALMFPNRASPNEVFVSGSDVGALLQTKLTGGVFTGSVGAFLGESLGLTLEGLTPRGVVLSARADAQPFGPFQVGEGDPFEGPFRLGLGAGALVRPAELFDRTGYGSSSMLDLRFSGSLRMSYRGLYLGVEYLHRRQTNELSVRPLVAQGAYTQASWFLRLSEQLALEPIARVGLVELDESFDPRLTGFLEGGLSFYPAAHGSRADRVRVTAQYLGERRFSEQEDGHGGVLSGRIVF